LDNAPAHALHTGGFFAAELAQAVAKGPTLDVHIVAALAAFLPIMID
jgi:hypothetical protein